MGMSRSQMLSVLNTMSDDKLNQAMQATGVETGVDKMELGDESGEGLESWNNREVAIESSPRPPIIDKSKFEKQPEAQQGVRPKYADGAEEMEGLEQFMPQEGMPEQ